MLYRNRIAAVVLFSSFALCSIYALITSHSPRTQSYAELNTTGHFCDILSRDISICSKYISSVNKRSLQHADSIDMQALKEKWKALHNASHDPMRYESIKKKLYSASGVYKDSQKAKTMNTVKTVLISVISAPTNQHIKYRHLLQNWYCYASQYKFKPLTYIVPHESLRYEDQVEDLTKLGINSEYSSYPTELFWSFVMKKRAHRGAGGGKVDFFGDIPSFNHFGAFVMLVPILEVLQYGYDAIYMDVDMAFLRDPIPYLMRSSSEFIVSLESRGCWGPSDLDSLPNVDFNSLEPNTGFMRIRSTTESIRIFSEWLIENVENNVSNDQKVLNFEKFGARLTLDCNDHIKHMEEPIIGSYIQQLESKYKISTENKLSSYARYCYLNEYLIQNGKIAFQCTHDGKFSSKADYVVSMHEQNFTEINYNTGLVERVYHPAVVHANYCSDKIAEFRKRGLWIVGKQNSTHAIEFSDKEHKVVSINPHTVMKMSNEPLEYKCHSYSYSNTLFARVKDWTAEYNEASKELSDIKNSVLVNGTIVDIRGEGIFEYVNGVFRKVSCSALSKYVSNKNITKIDKSYNFLYSTTKGPPIE